MAKLICKYSCHQHIWARRPQPSLQKIEFSLDSNNFMYSGGAFECKDDRIYVYMSVAHERRTPKHFS